jgi:hypothetical protein
MKLTEILKELKKLQAQVKAIKPVITRIDDGSETYEEWIAKNNIAEDNVIVVNIWVSRDKK